MFSMIKYHFILNLREKTMVFWTLAFPILLGTFFYFGIGGIDDSYQFQPIPVAVTGAAQPSDTGQPSDSGQPSEKMAEPSAEDGQIKSKGTYFTKFLEGISDEVVIPQWNLEQSDAEQKLEDGEVDGIFQIKEDEITLTVGKTGLNESILSALLNGFEQQTGILADVQAQAAYPVNVTMDGGQSSEYVTEVSLGGREVSSVTSYYFALLAMACLYMCFLGETAARRTQANISEIGKRISVSPVYRMKVVLANGISAYLVALLNIALVMLFLIKGVHGIDISMRPGYAVVTAMMGCLIGVTFGVLIESIGKWSQNIKSAILIGSSIFCAFLAGLMIGSMKDIIEKHAPIINRLNPAALIADSFYCICVYDDMPRLQMNLAIMGGMSVFFLLAAWMLTRRVRYDSL